MSIKVHERKPKIHYIIFHFIYYYIISYYIRSTAVNTVLSAIFNDDAPATTDELCVIFILYIY